MKKFTILFTVLTAFLVVLSWLLKDVFGFGQYFIPAYWVVFGFLAGVTFLVYGISLLGLKIGGGNQALLALVGITIRLLMSMVVVLVYLNKYQVDPIIFVFNFFSIYFIYTVFEISCLLLNLRHQIKK